MTNNQIDLASAVENLNCNRLNSFEANFINSIKDYTKKELRTLTRKQYELLKQCAAKTN